MSTPALHPTDFPRWLGRPGLKWYAAFAVLAVVLVSGLLAYGAQHHHGEIATHMRTLGMGGAPWGIYICFDIYFIGLSFAGITTAALIRLFRIEELRPLSRLATLLTLVTLPLGGACVMADLGRPMHGLMLLPKLARPQSPFFGTFTLVVSGSLFAAATYFFLAGRPDAARCAESGPRLLRPIYRLWSLGWRDTPAERVRRQHVDTLLSLVILPMLVIAFSTLGFVFGIQGGRPGWYSALQAPSFVVLAAGCGVGMLILVAAAARRTQGLRDAITDDAFRLLGNALWVLTGVALYVIVVEQLTANYASSGAESHVAREIITGRYAPVFLVMLSCFVAAAIIPFAQFALRRVNVPLLILAGLLVNVATILRRFLLVVPSQTEGLLLPFDRGTYVPNAIELRVVAGMLALAGLMFLVASQVFPLTPVVPDRWPGDDEAARQGAAANRGRRALRRVLGGLTAFAGVALAVTGFLLSLRVGTLPFLDPIVPFSPVMFIVGMLLVFASAAIYEVLPDAQPEAAA